jgi:hypothetical protein
MELVLAGVMLALLSSGQMQTFRDIPSVLRVQEERTSLLTASPGTMVVVYTVGMIGPVVMRQDAHLDGFTKTSVNKTL